MGSTQPWNPDIGFMVFQWCSHGTHGKDGRICRISHHCLFAERLYIYNNFTAKFVFGELDSKEALSVDSLTLPLPEEVADHDQRETRDILNH